MILDGPFDVSLECITNTGARIFYTQYVYIATRTEQRAIVLSGKTASAAEKQGGKEEEKKKKMISLIKIIGYAMMFVRP